MKPTAASAHVIRRIRKLMNYAADPSASPGEIENAIGHARRLMDQYHLDEASLQVTAPSAAPPGADDIEGVEVIKRRRRVDRVTRDLAHVPCIVCDVEAASQIRPALSGGVCEHVFFFGFAADVAIARALYEQLLIALRSRTRRVLGQARGKAFNDFAAGFTLGLINRALNAKRAARASATFGAIVLARESRLRTYLREQVNIQPPKPERPRKKVEDCDAFIDGMRSADGVSLATNQIGTAGARQPGLFESAGSR